MNAIHAPQDTGETTQRPRWYPEGAITRAIIAELLEYFSDARVSGIRLFESEALTIASGVFARLDSQDDPESTRTGSQ
jgi:hypothetical protein